MDLNSPVLLDIWPTSFEFFLHLAPNLTRLVIKLVHFVLGLLLEHIEPVFALDDRSFRHEEFELLESRVSFMTAPGRLDSNCSQNRTVCTFKAHARVGHGVIDLDPIGDARKDLIV